MPHSHHEGKMRFELIFPATLVYCALLAALAFLLDTPANIWNGLGRIIFEGDTLITDYIQLAGVGAALVNSSLVVLISLFVLHLAKDPLNGFTLVVLGLMSGFSLFGKNVFNIWPFLLGAFLYARLRRESFEKYANVALMSTSLSPVVSFLCFDEPSPWAMAAGLGLGVFIGFILPALSAYTFKIQNGMNLYNMGFACGLFAMMIVPVLTAFGDSPEKVIFGVISPGKNFCNAPMPYLLRILQGKNTGLDGKNDNTVLLLYNMLETIDLQPEEKTHFPVA